MNRLPSEQAHSALPTSLYPSRPTVAVFGPLSRPGRLRRIALSMYIFCSVPPFLPPPILVLPPNCAGRANWI